MQCWAEMETFVLQKPISINIIIYHREGAWWVLDKKVNVLFTELNYLFSFGSDGLKKYMGCLENIGI